MIRMEKGSWGGPFICPSFSALWRLFLAHFLLRNLLFLANRTSSAAGWLRVTKSLRADPRKQSCVSLFLWSFSSESRSALLINTEKKREGTIREIKLDFQISHASWKKMWRYKHLPCMEKNRGEWVEGGQFDCPFQEASNNYCQHFNKLCSACVSAVPKNQC